MKSRIQAEQRIAPYLIQSVAIQGIIGELVDTLTKEVTTSQKLFLIHLVEDIMKAVRFPSSTLPSPLKLDGTEFSDKLI